MVELVLYHILGSVGINGDLTLHYGLSKAQYKNGNAGYTISTLEEDQDPMLTTDEDDKVYIGYTDEGTQPDNATNGNIFTQDKDPSKARADNSVAITTVDMGKGDDVLTVRGEQSLETRVYLGEGDDRYELGGKLLGAGQAAYGAIFAEAGADTVTIGGNLSGGVYMGSGSDMISINGTLSGTVDLGSTPSPANPLPDAYLETYFNSPHKHSLGNDRAGDDVSATNTLNIGGNFNGGAKIIGGKGTDKVYFTQSGGTSINVNLSKLTDIDLLDIGSPNVNLSGINKTTVAQNDGLYVNGNASDTAKIDKNSGLHQEANTQKDGITYQVWSDDAGHKIYLQDTMQIQLL